MEYTVTDIDMQKTDSWYTLQMQTLALFIFFCREPIKFCAYLKPNLCLSLLVMTRQTKNSRLLQLFDKYSYMGNLKEQTPQHMKH